MKYIILCPASVRTGGPEACFQLSDALISQGFDAEMWIFTPEDVVDFSENIINTLNEMDFDVRCHKNEFLEYEKYKFKYFDKFSKKNNVTFIFPEILITLVPIFLRMNVIVWWLSVDNSFKALNSINLNFLRHPSVKHVVQSEYAMAFTKSLGIDARYLSDYTSLPTSNYEIKSITERPIRIAFNAGVKSISEINVLAAAIFNCCPNAEIIPIKDMDRETIYNVFLDSRLYIDLGKFPGKDRMPREALLLGCNLLIGNVGAGSNSLDFPIDEMYKVDVFDYADISKKASHMLLNPGLHLPYFEGAKARFLLEKDIFHKEVLSLALTANCHIPDDHRVAS